MLGFRQSKFKHVFGQGAKKELCYDNVRVTKNAWDSNLIKVNPLYISVNWEAAGGGAFAVIPLSERGKLPDLIPLFKGHSGPVLDTDFNPFNDSLIASGSEDGKICIWTIPSEFTVLEKESPDISPVSKLSGHSRKVGNVTFHPTADNVLASASGDYTLRLWDIVSSSNHLTLKHPDIIQSLAFNREGDFMATTGRDKKLRIWDPRNNKVAQEAQGHAGAKNSRAVYISENRIATAGFGKMSDRQLALWDMRNLSQPLGGFTMLDQSAGVIMPFYDHDTKVLYLAGKGDGNIRYYEFENDEFWPLAEYKSSDPQRGVAFMPKRALSIHENEVMRAYKTVRDVLIEPVSFIVPRRSGAFQEDIYPDTLSGEPALTADEWFSGRDAVPRLLKVETLYEGAPEVRPSKVRDFIPSTGKPVVEIVQPEKDPRTQVKEPAQEFVSPAPSQSSEVSRAPQDPQPPASPKPKLVVEKLTAKSAEAVTTTSASMSEQMIQRLLGIVETQSQAIESQERRISELEGRHAEYVQMLENMEAKLSHLALEPGGADYDGDLAKEI